MKINLPDIVGRGYGTFWNDKNRYRVLRGGKGSKKSTTTALNLIYNLMAYPDANLLVVRQVMDTHRTSTFAQLKWAQNKLGASQFWKNTTSPLEMTYIPTGQKILFRGFDDVLKLASTTVENGYLCWVWIEEAFEIESEADFDKLDMSVPRGQVPPNLFKQTTLTFNPWSESHWLKKRFFDKKQHNVSTYVTNYLCNEFLDDVDKSVFERMRQENPRRYAVAGLGEWGVAEGLIYENWTVEEFDKNNIGGVEGWKWCHTRGLDYGYTNDPTAFICAAFEPEAKLCYIYDEHYERKMLNSDIANMLISKGYAKDKIIADCAEPKSNDDLVEMGIRNIKPSAKGKDSIVNGIVGLQEYKMVVHPDCVNTIAELSSYCWSKNKNEDGINKPMDKNNHLMDALRYASQIVKDFKPISPEEEARRNRLRAKTSSMVGSRDMTGGWN